MQVLVIYRMRFNTFATRLYGDTITYWLSMFFIKKPVSNPILQTPEVYAQILLCFVCATRERATVLILTVTDTI